MQKLILIITKLELGGAQKVCLELANGLGLNQGFSTTILTGEGGLLDAQAQSGCQTVFIKHLVNSIGPRGLISNFRAFLQIRAFLKEELKKTPDLIVHTHSSVAGFVGRLAAWVAGVKNIVHTVHGFSFNESQTLVKRTLFKVLERLLAKLTSAIIFVSNKDLDCAVNELGIEQKKCHLIRACMQHWPAKIITKPCPFDYKRPLVIGTVACFKPQKNLLDLLKAFAFVSKFFPETKLVIVGDGQERAMLEKFIYQNQLSNVSFLGWVENLDQFYGALDIFALTSLWEGLPCAVVEALAREIPVVAYDAGGISEVVKSGQNGFVMPCKRLDLFEQKLLFLIQNYQEQLKVFQFGKFGHQFTPRVMIDKHVRLYKLLV